MKGAGGAFLPATEEDAEKIKQYRTGAGIRVKTTEMTPHNYEFHKKLFALFKFCYDQFEEMVDAGLEYRGQQVKPSFDRFREEMTILAGHYTAHHSLNGGVRLEAKSLSYAKMKDDEKERVFSSLIDAALRFLYRGQRDEAWLRNMVDQLLHFDR